MEFLERFIRLGSNEVRLQLWLETYLTNSKNVKPTYHMAVSLRKKPLVCQENIFKIFQNTNLHYSFQYTPEKNLSDPKTRSRKLAVIYPPAHQPKIAFCRTYHFKSTPVFFQPFFDRYFNIFHRRTV